MPTTRPTQDVFKAFAAILVQARPYRPHDGEDEDELQLIGILDGVVLLEDAIEHASELLHQVEVGARERELQHRSHVLPVNAVVDEVDEHGNVFQEKLVQCCDQRFVLLLLF
jgi:hypothetical protein